MRAERVGDEVREDEKGGARKERMREYVDEGERIL